MITIILSVIIFLFASLLTGLERLRGKANTKAVGPGFDGSESATRCHHCTTRVVFSGVVLRLFPWHSALDFIRCDILRYTAYGGPALLLRSMLRPLWSNLPTTLRADVRHTQTRVDEGPLHTQHLLVVSPLHPEHLLVVSPLHPKHLLVLSPLHPEYLLVVSPLHPEHTFLL